jgi:hypothetical protein
MVSILLPGGIRPFAVLPALLVLLLAVSTVWSVTPAAEVSAAPSGGSALLPLFELMSKPGHPAPDLRPDLMPEDAGGDWQALIDAAWGPGDPQEQQELFTLWRDTLDHDFACYINHDVDIPALCKPLWDELYPGGVSRGRFQAMMQTISWAHLNMHTYFFDSSIITTALEPGVPLLMCYIGGNNSHFGASLTVHGDEVFVYDVVPDHPLGLEPGDVILGYDGAPWMELRQQLLDADLPFRGYTGSSDASREFFARVTAGLNWHLFDTIDIRNYGSGEIQHLPTSLLIDPGVSLDHYGFEWLDVGIPLPSFDDWLTWGVLERGDQRIGYIYCLGWMEDTAQSFLEACTAMVSDPDLDGLIIDSRTNLGGGMYFCNDGLSLLFNEVVFTVDFGSRSDPDDHMAMQEYGFPGQFAIIGEPDSFFNKPIAVLLGPGVASAGDQVALWLACHPMARTFGKPTSTTFDDPTALDLSGHPDFVASYSTSDAYIWDSPGEYLNHVGFPVDEEIWLEPDDVVQGIDTVVERAIAWIAETEPMARPLVITGPGPGPDNVTDVHAYAPADTSVPELVIDAYGVDRYGVNVAAADVDGDGFDEILTGPGPGAVFGPHVRGFQPDTTAVPGLNFMAYGTNKYGVIVSGGDLNGDGIDEIITGAGPGAVFGPHVRGFSYDGVTVTPVPGVNYFAYGTPKWGVNVSTGDLDGDGMDEIITGAGPGAVYGPHVRGWNVDGSAASPMSLVSFMAYGTNQYGVNIALGDIDGDGYDEIITGPGPGAVFGPHVRGWNVDGGPVAPIPGISFFAFDYTQWGVGVGAGDFDGDGIHEILAGNGPASSYAPTIKVYSWDGSTLTLVHTFTAYPGQDVSHGVKVTIGGFEWTR